MRTCKVVGSSDVVETHQTVQCPRAQQATAVERCFGCSYLKAIDVEPDGKRGSVSCVGGDEATMPRGRVDVAEAAVRVRLGDLLGLETTCVRPDLSVQAVADLLVAHRLRAVPVVDDGRRLVGIVSKADLLANPGRRRRKHTVADIMTPLGHGLPEDAPVAYAISLMALEDLHEVPIVDETRQVIGMFTATDALRWVAQALGYVVPRKVDAERSDPGTETS